MLNSEIEKRKIKTQPNFQQSFSNSFMEGASEMKSSNLFKQSVPIKEYSNKFFRELKRMQVKTMDNSLNIASKQKRINTLMRKRQMVCRLSSKKPNVGLIELTQFGNNNIEKLAMTINNYGKNKKRVKTQAFNSVPLKQNSEISIIEIEQQLVLDNSFSKAIVPHSTSNLNKEPQQFVQGRGKRSSSNLKQEKQKIRIYSTDSKRDKISQSRGLEQYCKMFIKQKSQMVQKMWFDSRKPRQNVSKQIYGDGQNHFQTKKIYPIKKNSKRHTVQTYAAKKPIMRTPMRTIDNHPSSYMKDYESDMNIFSGDECFELKGWETSLQA